MAIQISTQEDTVRTTGEGAERAATLKKRVWDDTGTDIASGDIARSLVGVIRSDQHDTYNDLRAATYTVEQVVDAGVGRMYDVTWEYRPASLVPTNPDRDELTPGAPFTSKVSESIRTIWVDCWRVPFDQNETSGSEVDFTPMILPDNTGGSTNFTAVPILDATLGSYDIGGRPIDSRGKPVSCAVVQQVVDVRQRQNVRVPFAARSAAVGRRNSAMAFGAAIGKLLYLGADSVELDSGGFEYTHHFVWDDMYHARQQVWRDASTGEPTVGSQLPSAALSATYSHWGFPVYLVQPYPELVSFSGLGIVLP